MGVRRRKEKSRCGNFSLEKSKPETKKSIWGVLPKLFLTEKERGNQKAWLGKRDETSEEGWRPAARAREPAACLAPEHRY